ncbi:MAG TPA: Na+ dependent nucleoside transporter N-terminal domain-containing protein, partial [Candidatus Limnocylindria bacterium]|nr:Na+ dependent nucleoside transporter N-terminal domain-containing protein [Candidatus Limnocylindria bacterium]
MTLKLTSALGLLLLIAFAWLFSEHRSRFPWRAVIWGVV